MHKWGRANQWRSALGGVAVVALLTWAGIAVAAGSSIASVTFGGSNANLTITISGSGFGSAPPGVPCKSCTTPFLNIGGRIGCSDAYNIASWTDKRITVSGLQGNPGGAVIVTITNSQNKTVGVLGTTIPKSVVIAASPTIQSVIFSRSGKNLHMTIKGSGFGAAPRSVPADENLPFFAFVDLPFNATQWTAGYSSCGVAAAVTLKYQSWSPTRIVISGFGSEYGRGPARYRHWTVASGDVVSIAAADSTTGGLKMNYSFLVYSPLGIGTLWGGLVP